MDLHLARCENKPSPACEIRVPSSIADMLIRTISDTNMGLWTLIGQARSAMTNAMT